MPEREALYVTKSNLRRKSEEWLRLAEGRCRAKENFSLTSEKSALLVIDMQEFFTNPMSHAYVPAVDAILPNILSIVAKYRERRLPLFFTRYAFL